MTLSLFLYFFILSAASPILHFTHAVFHSTPTRTLWKWLGLWVGSRCLPGACRTGFFCLYCMLTRGGVWRGVTCGESAVLRHRQQRALMCRIHNVFFGFFGFGIIPEPVVFFTSLHTWFKGPWNMNERTRWSNWQSPQLKWRWVRVFEAEQQVQLPLMSAYLCLSLIAFMPFDPLLLKNRIFVLRILVCLVVYA